MTPRHRVQCAALVIGLAGAASGTAVWAEDRVDLDQTQIIGNRELPKVLYIVPWKKPLPGRLSGRPTVSVLDETLAPIDRDVFRRQIQLDTATRATAAPGGSPPANPP